MDGRSSRGLLVATAVIGICAAAIAVYPCLREVLMSGGRGSPQPSVPLPEQPERSPEIGIVEIGRSVQGRPIEAIRVGRGSQMIVIGAAIHGSEGNTSALVEALTGRLADIAESLPGDVSLFLVPRLNPDGVASRSRDNAHGVDLNRNWDTNDWQSRAAGTAGESPGACGSAPFSEPETAALASRLLSLRDQSSRRLTVIMYHSAYPPHGLIQPGYRIINGQQETDPSAAELARSWAARLGYTYSPTWPDYPITGEAIHWCAENNITCIDVELPGPNDPTEREIQLHLSVLLDMIQK